MDAARIAALLAPFLGEYEELNAPALFASISTYIDILVRWNARINLTAIRDPEQIVTRHFGESLFVARRLFPRGTVVVGCPAGQSPAAAGISPVALGDVGSGAGFPGIPIKLWSPNISLTLIESNHKKATFLRELTRALTLTDINIQNDRAESLAPHSFDMVTLRAVECFETILPIAANLLRPAGKLALLIGSAQEPQARLVLPSLLWSAPIPIPNSSSRILLTSKSSALAGT